MIHLGYTLGGEPVSPLPAEFLAEHGAQVTHALVTRRRFQGPGRRALFVGVVDDEDVGVGFFVLGLKIPLGRVRPEAPGIDAEHVDGGLALDDPLGELPAGAARRRDAEAVTLVEPEVGHIPGRADDGPKEL